MIAATAPGDWHVMLTAVAAVFTVVAVGAAARRADLLTERADQTLLKGLIRVLMPAFILSVLLGRKELLGGVGRIALPPMLGVAEACMGFGLAWAAARVGGKWIGLKTARQRRTFAFCVGMFNYGYVPVPLASAIFRGPTGEPDGGVLATLFVHNVGVDAAMWSVGLLILAGHLGKGWWRPVLNPPLGAIALALLLNATGGYAYIPTFLTQAIALIGQTAIPTGLLLTGATMADAAGAAKLHRGGGPMLAAALLRLGLLPILFLALASVLPPALGMTPDLRRVVAIQAAMPCAVFPVVLTRHYGGDVPTAVRVVLFTSILGLLTIPLWLTAGLRWLG